ncbi:zinc finger protein 780B-like [Culicoides brevitarsis]|uniref:zinc finger protein 780B-like n=1 Tax=Culicoides brevitarsis TaxID=469753 RepID=UPI00307BBB09
MNRTITTTICNVCNQAIRAEMFVQHLRKCEKENHSTENVGIKTYKENNFWIHEISTTGTPDTSFLKSETSFFKTEPITKTEYSFEVQEPDEEAYEEEILPEEYEEIEPEFEEEVPEDIDEDEVIPEENDDDTQVYEILYLEQEDDPNNDCIEYQVIEEQVVDDRTQLVFDHDEQKYAVEEFIQSMNQVELIEEVNSEEIEKQDLNKNNFQCQRCLKCLGSKFSLDRHNKICDARIKKLTCKQCGKYYKLQKQLSRHINEAHGVPIPCEKCGKPFSRKSNKDRHIETVHKTTPLELKLESC